MPCILIIDDEISVAKMLNVALTTAGYKVDVAFSGKEGIEKYNKNHFDMVITDIKMPEFCGKKVVRYIRKSTKPYIPVVGMSGTPWELNGEFDVVLPKPFSLDTLYITIRNLSCRQFTTKSPHPNYL